MVQNVCDHKGLFRMGGGSGFVNVIKLRVPSTARH